MTEETQIKWTSDATLYQTGPSALWVFFCESPPAFTGSQSVFD